MAGVNYNNPPVPYPDPIRYQLATPLGNRSQAPGLNTDPCMSNCYFEHGDDGRKFVVKRPGFTEAYQFGGGGAMTPQHLVYFKGYLFAANNNVLYNLTAPVANNYTSGSAFTQETAPTWNARYYFSAVVFREQIFVIGGWDGVRAFNDVWSSADGVNWQQVCSAAPWGARQAISATVFNDRLYVVGGVATGGAYFADVWVSDDGATWSQLTSNGGFSGRAGHRLLAYNNGIFLLGGSNAGGYLNDVWFSNDGSRWVQQVKNAAWATRSDFGVVSLGGKMYVYGGTSGATHYKDCWYTLDGINWTQATSAAFGNVPRAFFGYCVYEGKMWAIAGESAVAAELSDVYSSPDGAAWTLQTNTPGFNARHGVSSVAFKAPKNISSIRTPILWTMGGIDAALAVKQEAWRGNLNGSVNATWNIPSTGNNLKLDSCTAQGEAFLVLKDTEGLYVFTGNTLSKVTDTNYPQRTVPGVVNLDETVYVMDLAGLIYGCALETPLVWPAFNVIGADYESDAGVALAKHGNYVVAFGAFTTQLFYNSGSQFGSLLRPVKNASVRIGASFADSIAECDDILLWVGRGQKSRGNKVYRMDGLTVNEVPNVFIEKILQDPDLQDIRGSFMKFNGHKFYVLRFITGNTSNWRTMALDLETGLWLRLFFKQAVWDLWRTATDGVKDYFLRDSEGRVYYLDSLIYVDSGVTFDVDIYTNPIDGNTNRTKFCHSLAVIGDTVGSTIGVQYSDDDYQTWSSTRLIDLSTQRKMIKRLGDFRRRAFHVSHSANTSLRLEALELAVDVGFR